MLPHFDFGSILADLFQGALSELLHCKIRIKNSLKCAFLIDEQRQLQFMHHFVLYGYNVVLEQTLANFHIKQTMLNTLFVRFSNMATNDEATVNPPVPVTILKLRVSGWTLFTLHIMHVIRIKKH